MANQYFTITPTSGNTGYTSIRVSAVDTNTSGTIRRGQGWVRTDLGTHYDFEVKQYYKPILNQFGGKTIPASGGTIYFEVRTDYDYVFRSVPEWLTITDMSGNTINEGQKIIWNGADNDLRTYALTAGENTGTTRTVGTTFNMAHYSHSGSLATRYPDYFDVTQYGAVADKRISISPILLNVASGDTAATVSIVEENTTLDHFTISSAGTFTINATRSGSTMQLTFPINHDPQERRGYLSFYLYDADGGAWTSTITLVQAAGDTPYISVSPAKLYFDYNSSQSKTFTISTNTTVSVSNGNPSRFSISQSGNTVTVTATNYNYGSSDTLGTITVSDTEGVASAAAVNLVQRYRPRLLQQTSYPIPASGGTINFTIDSEYATRLKDIPAYVTISDTDGNTYTEGLEMTSAWTTGRQFIITFSQNDSTSPRDEGNFHLETNLNGTWETVGSFNFEQEPSSGGGYILITPASVYMDYTDNRIQYFSVSSPGVGDMTASIDDTTNFVVDPVHVTSDAVSVSSTTINNTMAYRSVTLTLVDDNDSSISGTSVITQRYQPYFVQTGNYVAASGGTLSFVVHTDYDIDFYDIPSWVTVKDNSGNTITNGQTITAANADGKTFTLEIAANTVSSSRSVSNTFCMRNYNSGTVLDYKQYFSFEQGGAQVQEFVDFEIQFQNIVEGNNIGYTISLESGTYAYETQTFTPTSVAPEPVLGQFDVIAAQGENITFKFVLDSCVQPPLVVRIDYNDGGEGSIQTLAVGEELELTTPYIPGASVVFTLGN